jgi:hypothetical protein
VIRGGWIIRKAGTTPEGLAVALLASPTGEQIVLPAVVVELLRTPDTAPDVRGPIEEAERRQRRRPRAAGTAATAGRVSGRRR